MTDLDHAEHEHRGTDHTTLGVHSNELVGIFLRFSGYTGAGILVSSIVTLAIMLWLPESMHSPIFVLTHSLIGGVVIALLIRSFGRVKTGSTGSVAFCWVGRRVE